MAPPLFSLRVFQLDEIFVIALRADIQRRLGAALIHHYMTARLDFGLDVGGGRAGSADVRHGGDPVALEDDQDVIVLVPVRRGGLARLEIDFPDADPLVVVQQLGAHIAERAVADLVAGPDHVRA
jgi:hypothetical protein